MQSWIAFISLLVRVAVWLKSHCRSILWKPQPEDTSCVLEQAGGSAPHHGEDQLVQGTVVVDALDSTSWRSHDAPDFGLEPIISAISQDEKLIFRVFYEPSGEVDAPSSKDPDVWKTIVKSVSKGRNLCIDISRTSEAFESKVTLIVRENLCVEEEIAVMFMEEFANAIRSNQGIESVNVESIFARAADSTLVTRFRTLVMNMILVILENQSLQFVHLANYVRDGLPLDRAAIESLVSALRRNLSLSHFGILDVGGGFFDTEGLKLFLKPLMEGGEGSYQGLKTLRLECTGIDDERAEIVASMLRHNTSLTCIGLHSNEIGPQGAACIGEVLRSNTTLRELDISDNHRIGIAGLKALVASLTHNMAHGDLQFNSSLIHLRMRGDLGVEDVENLEILVRQNTSLLSLDLGESSLLQVADNVIRLLEALKTNKCLEDVSLF